MKKALIISCFGWFERRLYYLYNKLENAGFDVEMYVSDFNHIKKEVIEERIEKVQYVKVPRYKKNLSVSRLYSHWYFGRKCYKRLNSWQPDVVYVLAPPNSCAYYAGKYKEKNPEKKMVVDIIDMWPESFPSNPLLNTPIFSNWKRMRDKGLGAADGIVIECDYYLQELGSEYKDKCRSLKLFKDLSQEELAEIEDVIQFQDSHIDQGTLNLCYLGSINNIIDLDSIQKILRELNLYYKVTVHMIGAGNSKEAFKDIVNKTGCILKDYGTVFDEIKKRNILTKCDFGLNLMKESVRVGLTIKSIDYLANGLPIINNIKGDTWALVEQEKIGVNYTSDAQKMIKDIENCNIKQMKNNAISCYKKNFSKESFEKQYDAIIQQMNILF